LTEIPEHLLKRSKAAKSGAAPSGGDKSPTAPAASAPAQTPAPVPDNLPNLDPEPVPAAPEPHFVRASKERVRVPLWALPMVAAVPLWAVFFAGTMQVQEQEDHLFTEAAATYTESGCAGCHGASGGGGSGYQLSDGEVTTTFPHVIDQLVHVARGSAEINGQTYGADGRRVSGDLGNMPAHSDQLTQIELEMVVFHERAVLSGEDTSGPGYQEWMEHLREAYESGDDTPIDLDLLLACADPAVTPGATGEGSPDDAHPCPGPHE